MLGGSKTSWWISKVHFSFLLGCHSGASDAHIARSCVLGSVTRLYRGYLADINRAGSARVDKRLGVIFLQIVPVKGCDKNAF